MKRKMAAGIGMGLLLLAALAVYAAWRQEGKTDNILTVASYRADILEEYETPAPVSPSESVKKRVSVKNEGSVDIFVRVSVTKQFGVRQGDGSFQKNPELDPDMIEISFNRTSWEQREDGWHYYRKVLTAGETTQEPLMESYTLSAKAGNEYKGMDAQIVVTMESVQAEGGALAAWGLTENDLGLTGQGTLKATTTGAEFLGKEQGFRFDAENTDLFASFKELSPGCARTQRILVKNGSGEEVELFLRAEEISSAGGDAKDAALLQKLMEEYAVIRISGTDGTLYEGPVCGSGGDASMKENISLGKFSAGESRMLTVTLSLSPDMGTEYEGMTGHVAWIFGATGEDGDTVEADVPKTGDPSRIWLWILLAAGALAFAAALQGRRAFGRNGG